MISPWQRLNALNTIHSRRGRKPGFRCSYEEAYGIEPLQFGAGAYDAVYAIKEAAEKAGVTPDMEVSDMCEAMKTAMTEITIDGLTGEGMTWNANGEPEKAPKAAKIVSGVYEMMD